ncbi:unnamed protein product, partial [Ectocarpus sp. 12 AP-2014]
NWESDSGNNFYKQFIAGILVAIAMIGLDQNMMQKTLTCKNVWDAQKNTLTYSIILAMTQFLFMGLGVLMYIYANEMGILLPKGENGFVDSALTALTTSFTYDFLDISNKSSKTKKQLKNLVIVLFSCIIFVIILFFSNSKGDVISLIFKVAGYTYGPLLGLYLLGMFSKIKLKDKWVPVICLSAPIITYLLGQFSINTFNFDFGFINIAVNASLTVIGLLLIKK